MKKLLITLFLSFVLVLSCFAQKNDSPQKIDEFGAENMETLLARSDNAVVLSLMNSNPENPDARLRIKIIGATKRHYSTAYKYASLITGYLKKGLGKFRD